MCDVCGCGAPNLARKRVEIDVNASLLASYAGVANVHTVKLDVLDKAAIHTVVAGLPPLVPELIFLLAISSLGITPHSPSVHSSRMSPSRSDVRFDKSMTGSTMPPRQL